MPFFKWSADTHMSLTEIAETFKHLAEPIFQKGDIDGVHHLYEKAFAQAMQGRRRGTLDAMQVQHEMGQALQEVMTQNTRERRRYFEIFRDNGWRD